jgi:hypothetical protein
MLGPGELNGSSPTQRSELQFLSSTFAPEPVRPFPSFLSRSVTFRAVPVCTLVEGGQSDDAPADRRLQAEDLRE